MCRVYRDYHRQIALTFKETKKKMGFIACYESSWRKLFYWSKDHFHDIWKPLDVCPVETAQQWLRTAELGFIKTTPKAKEILMNIVLDKNLKAVARFAPGQEKVANLIADKNEGSVVNTDELTSYKAADIVKLYNANADAPVKKFRDKETAVGRTKEALASAPIQKPVTQNTERQYKKYGVTGEDFSKRKGGYRATLNAFADGKADAREVWEHVKENFKPDYNLADVYSDIAMGKNHGYIKEL